MKEIEKKLAELRRKMTPKHVAFCEAYLIEFCAAAAYKSVYGAKKNRSSLDSSASALFRNTKVQEYLSLRFEERRAQSLVDVGFTIKKCIEVIKSDYVGTTVNFTKEDLDNMDPNIRLLVQDTKIKEKTYKDSAGEWVTEYEYQLSFMSKDNAIRELNKLLGGNRFNVDLTSGGEKLVTFSDIVGELEKEGKI